MGDVQIVREWDAARGAFVTKAEESGSSSGGSLPSGAGSPVGAVTPSGVGALYVDTTNGTLYIAAGVTSADWVLVGGVASQTGEATGVMKNTSGAVLLLGGQDRDAQVTGTLAGLTSAFAQWNGNGEGLFLVGDGSDNYSLIWSANGTVTTLVDTSNTLKSPEGGITFPSQDPHVIGAWWDNNGTLTRSVG